MTIPCRWMTNKNKHYGLVYSLKICFEHSLILFSGMTSNAQSIGTRRNIFGFDYQWAMHWALFQINTMQDLIEIYWTWKSATRKRPVCEKSAINTRTEFCHIQICKTIPWRSPWQMKKSQFQHRSIFTQSHHFHSLRWLIHN